jgi:hypothetical protein
MRGSRRSTVWLLTVAGASLSLVLGGCSTTGTLPGHPSYTSLSSPPPGSPAVTPEAAVHWMDGFCGAIRGFQTDVNAVAPPPAESTVADGKRFFSRMLDDYLVMLGKAIDRLAALSPTADPVGQSAQHTAQRGYASSRDKVTSAKTKLDAASATDLAAMQQAADATLPALQDALSVTDPVLTTSSSPELRAAAVTAPACMQGP